MTILLRVALSAVMHKSHNHGHTGKVFMTCFICLVYERKHIATKYICECQAKQIKTTPDHD